MFTGIIKDVGRLTAITASADPIFTITTRLPLEDLALGASIACNGICLTVIESAENQFRVQLSAETLARTTARTWRVGTRINLERALRMGDELGGHLLSGHVDQILTVLDRTPDGDSLRFCFSLPAALKPFIAPKGSIALDGVSLTVNEVLDDRFGVNIIPHTQRWTHFGASDAAPDDGLKPGDQVNAEVDQIARYVDRILQQRGL
jgi:riboflavin synthase